MAPTLRTYSEAYPPKNRRCSEVSLADIFVQDAHGTHYYDACSLVHAAAAGFKGLTPCKHRMSDVSNQPGVVVAMSDIEFVLTPEELARFAQRRLVAEEFYALAKAYGVFYEISCQFYDESTGMAQALIEEKLSKSAQLMAQDNLVVERDAFTRLTPVMTADGTVLHPGMRAEPGDVKELLRALGYTLAD